MHATICSSLHDPVVNLFLIGIWVHLANTRNGSRIPTGAVFTEPSAFSPTYYKTPRRNILANVAEITNTEDSAKDILNAFVSKTTIPFTL
ncbi:hypothetical protein TNCV_255291 [Trichonephila clavipes]|nr:hypothetical protein TNCV_255291 [Trichonephila clavipes]